MKQFWVDIRPWNKEIATTAIESGADALVVDRAEDVKRLGRITTIAPDGDLKIGRNQTSAPAVWIALMVPGTL